MDPRLKALIEVREVLKAEGWESTEPSVPLEANPSDANRSRWMLSFLSIVCFAAIATCMVLIGANHDLGRRGIAQIFVLGVQVEGLGPDDIRFEEFVRGRLVVTIDGKQAWSGRRIVRTVSSELDAWVKEVSVITSESTGVSIDQQGLLEVRLETEDRSILLGRTNIAAETPDGSIIAISCENKDSFDIKKNFYLLLRLKSEKSVGSSSTYLQATSHK